jgi:hypothetical protein
MWRRRRHWAGAVPGQCTPGHLLRWGVCLRVSHVSDLYRRGSSTAQNGACLPACPPACSARSCCATPCCAVGYRHSCLRLLATPCPPRLHPSRPRFLLQLVLSGGQVDALPCTHCVQGAGPVRHALSTHLLAQSECMAGSLVGFTYHTLSWLPQPTPLLSFFGGLLNDNRQCEGSLRFLWPSDPL